VTSLQSGPTRARATSPESESARVLFTDAIPHDYARQHLVSSDSSDDARERLVIAPDTDA